MAQTVVGIATPAVEQQQLREPRAELCLPGRAVLRLSAVRRDAAPESSPPAPGGLPSCRSTAAAGGASALRNLRGWFGPDVSRVARVLVLVFASAVLSVLAPSAPARAAAYVSNLEHSGATDFQISDDEGAVGFVTGDYPDGYTLTSVEIAFGAIPSGAVFNLFLWPASESSSTGSPVIAVDSQIVQFTGTSNLDPNSVHTFSPAEETPEPVNDIETPGIRIY